MEEVHGRVGPLTTWDSPSNKVKFVGPSDLFKSMLPVTVQGPPPKPSAASKGVTGWKTSLYR